MDVVFFVKEILILASDIAKTTRKRPVLSKVYDYKLNGWPSYVTDAELKPYLTRRHELSVDNGLILSDIRVVEHSVFGERLLQDLHGEYLGKCK